MRSAKWRGEYGRELLVIEHKKFLCKTEKNKTAHQVLFSTRDFNFLCEVRFTAFLANSRIAVFVLLLVYEFFFFLEIRFNAACRASLGQSDVCYHRVKLELPCKSLLPEWKFYRGVV